MLIAWQKMIEPARELEPGGAAGGAAGGGGAAGAGAAGGETQREGLLSSPQVGATAGDPAALVFPDKFDDKFKGKDATETIAKLWSDISGRPRAPEKADGYKLELEPEIAKRFGDLNADPAFKLMAEVAHAAGVDNGLLGKLFVGTYTKLIDAGLMPKPIDWDAELMKLAPQGERDMNVARAEAQKRANAVGERIVGLAEGKKIDDGLANHLLKAIHTDTSVLLGFEQLLKLIPSELGVRAPAGGITNALGLPIADEQSSLNRMYPTMVKA